MTPGIQNRIPKRQAVLFLLILAAPCLVLGGLGLQVNRQERQLAERRAGEERARRLAQFQTDLLTELERIKRQATVERGHEAAVLVAAVRDGDLVVPFDSRSHASEFRRAMEQAEFGARIRQAEQEETASTNTTRPSSTIRVPSRLRASRCNAITQFCCWHVRSGRRA